jgi:hypothetical protein
VAPIAPSGVVPVVFAGGTTVGFMVYVIDSTPPFTGERAHLFGFMALPPPPPPPPREVNVIFCGVIRFLLRDRG